MSLFGREHLRITADAVHPGTTVRYDYRTGSCLATVVRKTDRHVVIDGEGCHAKFDLDQADELLESGRLRVVLDDVVHADAERPR
ncbi:hypothetical protein G9464_07075 [Halostella sp. JP-L12]|uniref:hypothetical protein n=1 Tax=Halostella TaxID=1843185 RepID=UPI000EF7C3BB|nr:MULTISPECIES: hypothetical protein [Halostella]NHN47356.1 hypothetical protein [Halostella sp. JP-L12]